MLVLSRLPQLTKKRYIWATVVLCNIASRSAAATAGASSSSSSCISTTNSMSTSTKTTPPSYPLIAKYRQSHDSWLLRFSLPAGQTYLGQDPTLPTCISVHHNSTLLDEATGKLIGLLKKSYSPVSHPATIGSFDLLVKSYKPQPGGGVGHAICNLQLGESLIGKLKSERLVHGSPTISKRWDTIGLIAGGTGVAPLVQLVRICLEDPNDSTKIQLLSINRKEEDILMKDELDKLANEYPNQFTVRYSLTGDNVREDWDGLRGRGSVDMVRNALPPPSSSSSVDEDVNSNQKKSTTMIFVCGTDGFRDMWAGPIARAPPLPDGSKGPKIQGPLLGVLKDAGYDASDVFKY